MNPEMKEIFDHARYAANRMEALDRACNSSGYDKLTKDAIYAEVRAANRKVDEVIEKALRDNSLSVTEVRMAAKLGFESPLPYRPRDYFAKAEKQTKRKPHYKLSSKPIRAGRYVVITRGPRAGQIHKVTSVRLNSFSTVYINQDGKSEICCFPLPDTDGDRVVALPVQTKLWQEPTWHIM